MANIEEKLNQFSTFVLKDAAMQRDEMMKRFEQEKKRRVDKEENELLSDAYADIQSAIEKCRRENNERVLKIEMERKKQLIRAREQMIDDIFSRVRIKLDDFISSEEYGAWLVRCVDMAIEEFGAGKTTVYLTKADMQYEALIKRKYSDISVEQADSDFIGGLCAFHEEKQIFLDYSIKTMLGEKRESFLQKSRLSIN